MATSCTIRARPAEKDSVGPRGGCVTQDPSRPETLNARTLIPLRLREHWGASADKIKLANVMAQPREALMGANFGKLFRIE